MAIPLNADTDFWLAQDYAQRVMDALWNKGDSDDYLDRRRQLLAAIEYVEPKADEKPSDRGFDVVS